MLASPQHGPIDSKRATIVRTRAIGPWTAEYAAPRPTLCEGNLVGGRYRVEGTVGEGGMGIVVAARHVELGHRVAIKYLRPGACQREDMVARFRWEALAGLRLRNEHVVRVTDAGTLWNSAPYIVMELLEGMDLGQLLGQRGGPLPVEEAVDYILQACAALAEAHEMGIVHRDLKPENLFLTRRADGTPLVKVIDFGISSGIEKTVDLGPPEGPPNKVEIMGSPAYMSPEQVRNFEAVDARADVWSLGAILYEMVTGQLIFTERSLGPLLRKICRCSVASARTLRADLPEGLDRVILRCVERDMEARIPDVSALARALLPFASERSRASMAPFATRD